MTGKALVKQEAEDLRGLGPAMRSLNARQRAFVRHLFESDGRKGSIVAAYRSAGYAANSDPHVTNASAQQMVHREDIQAAITEYTKKELHHLGPAAVRAKREIVNDPLHKDRDKAANSILERLVPTVQRIETNVTVEINHTKDAIESLKYMRELNVPREKLLEHFGPLGLPRYERMLAEQEAAAKGEIIEAEFEEIPPAEPDIDWANEGPTK
jgi:phage terminase small subunit